MSWASDIDELNIVTFFGMASNKSACVCVCEVEASASAPMTKKPRFYVLLYELPLQERVRLEEDLSGGQVIGGALERENTVDIKPGAKCVDVEGDAKLFETAVGVEQARFWWRRVLIWHGGLKRRRVAGLLMTMMM